MNQVNPIILSFILIAILSGCGNKGRNPKKTAFDSYPVPAVQIPENRPALAPLPEGEIHVTDKLFGKTMELTGTPLNIKENIMPFQLLVKDKYLIINNYRKDSIFMIFELPDIKCVASFGYKGRGPEEFISPLIVKTLEDSILCYIYEKLDDKVYKITRDHLYPEYYLTLPKQKHDLGDKQIIFMDSKSAYYSATSGNTKKIFYFNKDSLPQEKIVKDLAIPEFKGSWQSVIGDFGINMHYGRIVYAYKYFKRLKIIDEQTLKERNIIFDKVELKKGLNDVETLEPTNITHFWGMSPNDKYFWMLYSGRTPIDVQTDNRNNKKYIFVEKYDWNGNPLKRYKLDDWGYFCVDEERNTLYLASTASINSLIRYDLTDSSNK
jgi:hypothetical protein